MMKNFIKRIFNFSIFFSFFFIGINIVYFAIIASTDLNLKKRFEILKFNNPDYNLLVFGNSLAFDGIDTELLTRNGIKSYNLALGGSSILTSYIQLKEYLDKNKVKPHYVLLGINSYMESFDDRVIHPIVEVTMKDHKYKINDIPILKFKWFSVELAKKLVSKKHRKAKMVNGQCKFQKEITDNTNYIKYHIDLNKFKSSDLIGDMAKLCHDNGIELIIIEMPGYKNTQNVSEYGPYELRFINGCSAKLYNFNYQEFCSLLDPNKDWVGKSHLNEFGAAKFTKELVTIFKK